MGTDTILQDEISLIDIVRWFRKWWWLVVGGVLVGLIAALIIHLALDRRFTARLDATIAQPPLGDARFVQNVSVGLLQKQAGPQLAVTFGNGVQKLTLTERDLPEDAIATRQGAMRNATMALGAFLKDLVASEYSRMQADFETMPASPESYVALAPLRLYIEAVEDDLFEPVTIVSESSRLQGVGLAVLLLMGAMGGMGLAVVTGFVTDQLRNQSINPTA